MGKSVSLEEGETALKLSVASRVWFQIFGKFSVRSVLEADQDAAQKCKEFSTSKHDVTNRWQVTHRRHQVLKVEQRSLGDDAPRTQETRGTNNILS